MSRTALPPASPWRRAYNRRARGGSDGRDRCSRQRASLRRSCDRRPEARTFRGRTDHWHRADEAPRWNRAGAPDSGGTRDPSPAWTASIWANSRRATSGFSSKRRRTASTSDRCRGRGGPRILERARHSDAYVASSSGHVDQSERDPRSGPHAQPITVVKSSSSPIGRDQNRPCASGGRTAHSARRRTPRRGTQDPLHHVADRATAAWQKSECPLVPQPREGVGERRGLGAHLAHAAEQEIAVAA